MTYRQTRSESLIEAATHAWLGCALGFPIVWAVSAIGLSSLWTTVVITIVMFAVSTIRSYVLRRLYEDRKRDLNQG
jgi:RsiW-degrading membrane proteinase PrsW (M82 family)